MNQEPDLQESQEMDIVLPQKITMKNTFPAEFALKGKFSTREYIYIEEIGDDDITIYAKTDIQPDQTIDMKLYFNGDSGECTVTATSKETFESGWKRYVMEYDSVSPEAGIIITAIVAAYPMKIRNKVKSTHPKKNYQVQMYNAEKDDWQSRAVFVKTISLKGMEYRVKGENPMDVEDEFVIKLFLGGDDKPVALGATMLCEKTMSDNKTREGWLEFTYIPEVSREKLEESLERSIQGEIGETPAEPIERFM